MQIEFGYLFRDLWRGKGKGKEEKGEEQLTLGEELFITTPNAIEGVLKQPPDQWLLGNARRTHYHSLIHLGHGFFRVWP